MSMEHELKTWPTEFDAIRQGYKTFELRHDDRPYHIDDVLVLRCFNPETNEYTGDVLRCRVTYLTSGRRFGLESGWVIMAIALEQPVPVRHFP